MNRSSLLSLLLLLGLVAAAQKPPLTVTAYFAGDTAAIRRYDPSKLTHIIYSFCHLKGNRLHVDDAMDTLRIRKLVALKQQNPDLKVLLSLGGWGGCATCSDVFSSADNRQAFARSVGELGCYFGTDGIDLDWEYPAVAGYPGHAFKPEDKPNFTALVRALRTELGPKQEISFAAGGFQKFIDEAVEWAPVMQLVDRVNLMSYDLVHGYSKATGHHTALYSTPQQRESADNAIKALIQAGVAADKIVIGAAFYARVWRDVPDSGQGLYQPGVFHAAIDYRKFPQQLSTDQGFVHHWDNVAKAPYRYNKKNGQFATFDDTRSLQEKVRYAQAKGLNGIMFWELSHDLSSGGLLDAIHEAKHAAR